MRVGNVGKHALYTDDDRGQVEDAYVSVSVCGYYQVADYTNKSIRPDGRVDYHILYVTKNRIQIILNGEKRWVREGEFVLYRPYEPQAYFYYADDRPEIYWVHFSGNGIAALLENLGFGTGNVFHVGKSDEFCELFRNMIGELQIKRENYEQHVNRNMLHLLTGFSLRSSDVQSEIPDRRYGDIKSVIEHINNHYWDDLDNESYAEMCNMSKYHFMRIFKEYVGVSPHAYKIKVRIRRARELLKRTDLSVSAIACKLGYADVACFGKQFKKVMGTSPLEYRKNKDEAEDFI